MPQQHEMNPRDIVILRESRQRQMNIATFEELKQSVKDRGLIQPIVARRKDGAVVLVAGERRLQASLAVELPSVPVLIHEDMTDEEAEAVELIENIERKELHWRDHVKAVGRLHKIMASKAKNWKVDDTATKLSFHVTHVRKILHVFDNIDSARIVHVESIEQAYNTLHRFAERKAESIVADIVANGAAAFGLGEALGETVANEDVLGEFTITGAVATFDEPPREPKGASRGGELAGASDILEPPPGPAAPVTGSVAAPPPAADEPILCTNFLEWVKTYSGPKFSLIHCDFPYGNYRGEDSYGAQSGVETEAFYDNHEEIYWNLLSALTVNLDRVMSYSAHMIFWFNMNFYTRTVQELRAAGLFVHDHPLVWHKTPGGGGIGVVPGTAVSYPRRTYDTALLAVRGNRPLAKPGHNSYAAPTVSNKIHPSQKPESMLRFFLQMVVDETTTVLDPTCGSAAALRAAEDLGARSILGIEMDPNYVASALARTKQARVLRTVSKTRKDE